MNIKKGDQVRDATYLLQINEEEVAVCGYRRLVLRAITSLNNNVNNESRAHSGIRSSQHYTSIIHSSPLAAFNALWNV